MASSRLVVFRLDDGRYGLRLETVERVIRLVEITRLPKAPDIVLGVINVHGRIVPVVDLRGRFGLPERSPELTDQLVIARMPRRSSALLVDAVDGIFEYFETEAVEATAIVPGTRYLAGVAKLADGMVLIQDLAALLALEEERQLDKAIADA